MKQSLALLAVCVVAAAVAVYTGRYVAFAIQAKPFTSTSWYVALQETEATSTLTGSTASWAYLKGYARGQQDRQQSGTQNTVVVLDFFRPMVQNGVYGASGYNHFIDVTTIRSTAAWFAYGYLVGAYGNGTNPDSTSHLTIALGVSNAQLSSLGTSTASSGIAWGTMVNNTGADLVAYGYADRVSVAGAIDFEPNFSNSGPARTWVDAYASTYDPFSPHFLYNFGSADGCPSSGTQTATPGSCDNGWTQEDVLYISYRVLPAYPLPEIYNSAGTNAKQWQRIMLYGYLRYGAPGYEPIKGPMSQYWACVNESDPCTGMKNTPTTAWNQLWTELNSDTRTAQNLQWSTDIQWRH